MMAEASRPQSYKNPLEESEMDLFAGLSFPSVPTSSITLKTPSEKIATLNIGEKPDMSTVETYGQMNDDTDVETTQLIPIEEKTSTKRGNLSTLYATEVIVSEVSTYPELPSLGHNSPIVRTSHNQSNHKEYEEESHNESSSLLRSEVLESVGRSSPPAPALFVQNTVPVQHQQQNNQQQPQPEDVTLVTDLIRENTRLADELANLRGIAQLQSGGGMKSAPLVSSTADKRASSSIANGVSTGAATSSSAPATGIKISDTSMPPKQGVKYVCCGGCRQWLLAPRDAVYVACGSCQAVNNCNLVSNKARSNADAETRALQQPAPVRRTLPWFLDCFGGVPADA